MISWFKKQKDWDIPSLAIVFESGLIQLMKNENDNSAVVVDTGLVITSVEWNPFGSIIAVAGKKDKATLSGDEKSHEVKFFNPYGEILHVLRFGGNICGLSWEGDGQRIALAVDCYIFFATIRPYYKWCYFSNTLGYAFNKSQDQKESTIMFWNSNTKEKHIKLVKNLSAVTACGDFCCIAAKNDEIIKEYSLIVCNGIGSPIDSCNINLEPHYLTMNHSDIFAASRSSFCKFHFHSPKSKTLMMLNEKPGLSEERCTVYEYPNIGQNPSDTQKNLNSRPICCITCSETVLVLGDTFGRFFLHALPQVYLYHIIQNSQPGIPSKISLNLSSHVMACINIYGELSFHGILDYWANQENAYNDSSTAHRKFSDSSFPSSLRLTTNISAKTHEVDKSKHVASDFDLQFPKMSDHTDSSSSQVTGMIDTFDSPTTHTLKFSSQLDHISSKSAASSLLHDMEALKISSEQNKSLTGDIGEGSSVVSYNEHRQRNGVKGTTDLSKLEQRRALDSSNSRANLNVHKATSLPPVISKPLAFDRKYAWDIEWAADDGQMCAIMDKMRMYIYRGTEPEEPMTCMGYMCEFKDLEVTAVLLSDLMLTPDDPDESYFFRNDVKSLRDTRNLIVNVGLKDAAQFIEENPH
ncbi:WD repeat-containing protein 35, partial [Stegodyphus mimosarum]